MRLLSRMSLPFALLAVGLVGPAIGSASADSPTHAAGHVYVNDNTAGTNTIAAFDRHADGSLTPVDGSPFPAGGAGAGKGLASQGAVQVTDNGRYLLAVDAGSNQVSVLRIEHDGSLRLVSVASSGGALPDSVTVHGDLVYVANSGAGDSNYTGFILAHHGELIPLPGSTVTLPATAAPADVLFNQNGTKLVGTKVGPSVIDSFTVGRNGLLAAAPDSPLAAQGLGPFGSEFRPTNPNQLFVSNAHNIPADSGTISVFNDSSNGSLNPIAGSPFADDQTAPCWVERSITAPWIMARRELSCFCSPTSGPSAAAPGVWSIHRSAERKRLSSNYHVIDVGVGRQAPIPGQRIERDALCFQGG